MKSVYLVLCCAMLSAFNACSNVAVDPIVPVVDHIDTNVVANTVQFTVEVTTTNIIVHEGQQLRLNAVVRAHVDTHAKDSAVRNYVLRDSSVTWSIEQGMGSISSDGVYTAPRSIATSSVDVIVSARAHVSPVSVAKVSITVRRQNLLPTTQTSYWLSEHCPVDPNTGQRDESKVTSDSSVVATHSVVDGRQADGVVRYVNNAVVDTTWYINDNGVLWQYNPMSSYSSVIPIPAQWTKIYDADQTRWVGLDTTFVNAKSQINGQAAVLNGSIQLVCTRSCGDSTSVGTQTFASHPVVMTWHIDLVYVVEGLSIPVQLTVTSSRWFVDGIGCARTVTTFSQQSSSSGSASKFHSEEIRVQRYSVK